jgi:hypothetical protein
MSSGWFEGILPSLAAAAIWTCLLATVSAGLTATRSAYLHGLAAGVVAYLGQVGATSAVVAVAPTTPMLLVIIAITPLIEEGVRLTVAADVARRTDWRGWLAFGIAYGSFEAGLKLGDALVYLAQQGRSVGVLVIGAAAPIVPLLLHLFLTVTVFALLRTRTPALLILAAAAALHALHNWSAVAWQPTSYSGLAFAILFRSLVLLTLIAFVLGIATRSPKAASRAAG